MKGKKLDKMEHMSRHYRASGGGVEEGVEADDRGPSDVYAGGDSEVVKSARAASKPFKKGGKVSAFVRGKMSEGMEEAAEKKRMKKKDGGCATGEKAHERMDRAPRKGRASGGPLSTASKVSERPDFKGMKDIND